MERILFVYEKEWVKIFSPIWVVPQDYKLLSLFLGGQGLFYMLLINLYKNKI
jgi:hypothetical protein